MRPACLCRCKRAQVCRWPLCSLCTSMLATLQLGTAGAAAGSPSCLATLRSWQAPPAAPRWVRRPARRPPRPPPRPLVQPRCGPAVQRVKAERAEHAAACGRACGECNAYQAAAAQCCRTAQPGFPARCDSPSIGSHAVSSTGPPSPPHVPATQLKHSTPIPTQHPLPPPTPTHPPRRAWARHPWPPPPAPAARTRSLAGSRHHWSPRPGHTCRGGRWREVGVLIGFTSCSVADSCQMALCLSPKYPYTLPPALP